MRTVFPVEAVAKVAKPHLGEKIPTAYGYIVDQAGTVYGMHRPHFHGVVLAALYPDLALQWTSKHHEEKLEFPEDFDYLRVMMFQEFELDHSCKLPIIRIGSTRMIGPPTIDIPDEGVPVTEPQFRAVQAVMRHIGIRPADEVQASLRDMKLRDAYLILEQRIVNAAPDA